MREGNPKITQPQCKYFQQKRKKENEVPGTSFASSVPAIQ
jgi:hypothetical protein